MSDNANNQDPKSSSSHKDIGGLIKNRFSLENESGNENRFQEKTEFKRVYQPMHLLWIAFILLFLLLLSFGIWYYYKNKTEKLNNNNLITESNGNIERLIEKPYLPDSSLNPELNKCIKLYNNGFIKKSFHACEEFLNKSADDKEKSIALTVIGVIFDETGRYPVAIERLNKAVNYDPENVYAFYNLALAYKHAGMINDARQAVMKAKKLAPNNPRIALLAGNFYNSLGEGNSALETYLNGLNESPDDPYLLYNLAITYYRQGKVPEAIESFTKVIRTGGNDRILALSHGHLGTIYYNREELDKAEHHFREALRVIPEEAKYLYNLGIILQQKNENEEATKLFSRAVQAGSNDPEIYTYIAESFRKLKLNKLAIESLKKGLELKPDSVDLLFPLADLYYEEGDLGNAELILKRIVSRTGSDSYTETALVNLGIILDDMERYAEAIDLYSKALAINPENENAYYHLGISYKNAGKAVMAIQTWKRALMNNSGSVKIKKALGDFYMEKGYKNEAADIYEQIVKSNPDDYKSKLSLASIYIDKKNYDSAKGVLNNILNNSNDAGILKLAHQKLAVLYLLGYSDNTKAKEEAYRATYMDSDDMEGRIVLARVLLESGSLIDREKAIEELLVIVRSEVKPEIASTAYNYLGIAYYKNAEFRKALAEFQNAIDMDPSLTEAYENKRAARAAYEDSIHKR